MNGWQSTATKAVRKRAIQPGPNLLQTCFARSGAICALLIACLRSSTRTFRALAKSYLARERHTVTLQPTALVNEAYLRMVDQTRVDWKGRTHFFAVGAMAMRRILVNRAVAAKRLRRGGQIVKIDVSDGLLSTEREEDVLAVDEALKDLAKLNERHAKIIELTVFWRVDRG